MNNNIKNPEINFVDSYQADTSMISEVISRLIDDLKEMGYPRIEIDEIVISMDEALTNAVQETLRRKKSPIELNHEINREIAVRYKVTPDEFDATVIDHGKGLDILNLMSIIPDTSSPDYYDQIVKYVTESEKKKLRLTIDGKEISFKGVGAGLKIMLAFMDSISIDLIDKEKVLADSVTEFTDGTILNMKRKRRYR